MNSRGISDIPHKYDSQVTSTSIHDSIDLIRNKVAIRIGITLIATITALYNTLLKLSSTSITSSSTSNSSFGCGRSHT